MSDDKSVNVQNFPRGHEIKKIVIAPEGSLLVSFDYSALEARVIAMVTQDKEFCADIWLNIDTHMKWVDRIAELYPKILEGNSKKDIRTFTKSALVFGSFYGSVKESVVNRFKNEYGVPEHIMGKIYDEFWDTYKEAKKKQKLLIDFYNNNGYIRNIVGRRRHGVLSVNKITNTPIQSVASYDICLVAGDRLSRLAYKLNKPQYQYVLNVHDDLTFYIPKSSLEEDVLFIAKEMVNPVYDWIIVPLEVECKIGSNWYELENVGKWSTLDWWTYTKNKWVQKENKNA